MKHLFKLICSITIFYLMNSDPIQSFKIVEQFQGQLQEQYQEIKINSESSEEKHEITYERCLDFIKKHPKKNLTLAELTTTQTLSTLQSTISTANISSTTASTSTTTSSTSQAPTTAQAVTPPIGVFTDNTISGLLQKGYSIIYNYPYSHKSTKEEMINIKNTYCTKNTTILCMAGGAQNSDKLIANSCYYCQQIFTLTTPNNPQKLNGVYWYFTDGYSIGYSDLSNIAQNHCDTASSSNSICWHLCCDAGGWKVGTITALDSSNDYNKYLFIKSN